MSEITFELIDSAHLSQINGGNDLWDAFTGAVKIVANPIDSTVNFARGVAGARNQGHSWSDSFANGIVQAPGAGHMNAPDLSKIPANPPPVQPQRRP